MNKAIAAACCAWCVIGTASAQNYPSKTVRIIVPYPAGGTSDILSRLLSPKLNEAFGQSVIVDNRPGANGNIGADLVAKSGPDGYTCCSPTSARWRSAPASTNCRSIRQKTSHR